MDLDNLKQLLPEYAKGQQRNLDALVSSSVLNEQQKWGCFFSFRR